MENLLSFQMYPVQIYSAYQSLPGAAHISAEGTKSVTLVIQWCSQAPKIYIMTYNIKTCFHMSYLFINSIYLSFYSIFNYLYTFVSIYSSMHYSSIYILIIHLYIYLPIPSHPFIQIKLSNMPFP